MDEEAAEPVGRITLIGTIHNPLGHCTVEALHGLLERLAPDVIFEEWRPCDVAARDADLRWQSLDRHAITRYVEGKTVQQVPVEDYELPADFGADANRLLEYVNRHSPEYRALQRVADEEAYQYGFAYLNSPSRAALHRRQQALMEHTIALSGDAALQQILNTWTALMRQREMAMSTQFTPLRGHSPSSPVCSWWAPPIPPRLANLSPPARRQIRLSLPGNSAAGSKVGCVIVVRYPKLSKLEIRTKHTLGIYVEAVECLLQPHGAVAICVVKRPPIAPSNRIKRASPVSAIGRELTYLCS